MIDSQGEPLTRGEASATNRIMRSCENLGWLVAAVLERWPSHQPYLERSLGAHDGPALRDIDWAAAQVRRLMGDEVDTFCSHYRWMCDVFNLEALHFRRTGEYRCKTFAEAQVAVYQDQAFMEKYMDGLLLSQALWFNHARSFIGFKNRFLPMIQPGSDYLEIGPGHGLFLALAAQQPQVKSLTAWDISNESLRKTGEALRRLDVARPIQLEQRDVMAVREAGSFDAIVIAEVLEHLEAPLAALQSLTRCLRQNGRMFVNVPINSPAPDHIFLLRSPQEAADLVRAAGLRIIDESLEPMSGRTIEQAMAGKATVTCLYIAERDE